MQTLVVAEKPSVARDIARVLGATRRADGCLEGNGYRVTWALGHLVHLAEPDDYDVWKGSWSFARLPMVPSRWKLKLAPKTAKQFKVVKGLLNANDTGDIVCATDAGREGELIFRLIYEHARCQKPFRRLWISSLTPSAIKQGFDRLRDGGEYAPLAQAARARAQADWLVGLNLTRAYTVRHGALLTIGRVQTPTLAMLVAREREIEKFKKEYFYELVASLRQGFKAKYAEKGVTRIQPKARAEELHHKLSPHKTGTVTKITRQTKRQRPPALYDLTGLQRDANRRFGFTAARTLEYAQALYETHKLISYPRTESRHLSEDMVPQLPGILKGLDHPQAAAALERLRQGHRLGKAYVDRSKLSDHHGILPTGKAAPANLAGPLKKVFDLVVARFVGMFLPEHVYEETQVELDIGGACFIARGRRVLQEGWKVVEGRPSRQGRKENGDGDSDQPQALPELREGQQVDVDGMEVVERETSPPKRYTDATLLNAMKNAGRRLDDEQLAAAMRDSGLGTPATRAETIEKLMRSGLAERAQKTLVPTVKGKALVGAVDAALASPELTGQWEQRLKDIEEGRLDDGQFYASIVAFVEERVAAVEQAPAVELPAEMRRSGGKKGGKGGRGKGGTVSDVDLGACPKCGKGRVVERAKGYGCSRFAEGCGFIVWKKVAGKTLGQAQVKTLLAGKQTARLSGFRSKAGKPFEAALKLDGSFAVEMVFGEGPARAAGGPAAPTPRPASKTAVEPQNTGPKTADTPVGLACPRCGQGRLIEGRRGFGCQRYREGCSFVVWKEVAGKKLTQRQLADLVKKGKTRLMSGFKNAAGASCKGRLRLDERCETVLEEEAKEGRAV